MEIDASGEPLTERLVGPWVDRTPENAILDIRAHRLLTHHPAPIESLWPEVRDTLTPALRDRRQLYAEDLPARSLDAALDRFLASIASVREFGKLGSVVFPFPSYFTPGARAVDYLEWLRGRSGDLPIAIEFRHRDWVAGSSATPRWSSCASISCRTSASTSPPGSTARCHRSRSSPPTPPTCGSTGATPARGNAGPMPATTASHTTTRTPTSSPGCRAWRSSPPRRGRCTSPSRAGPPTPRCATRASSCAVLSGEPAPARTPPPSGGNARRRRPPRPR